MEQRLLNSDRDSLSADVVVAPHHGSRSSSTEAFVQAVGAEHVLFAAGWANRYGFPAPVVVDRWRRQGAETFNTAVSGSLSYVFGADGIIEGPDERRKVARRFWHR